MLYCHQNEDGVNRMAAQDNRLWNPLMDKKIRPAALTGPAGLSAPAAARPALSDQLRRALSCGADCRGGAREEDRQRARPQHLTPAEFFCGLCFALCFFAFMLTEAFVNERCAVILGSDAVNPVYMLGLVCTGLGFLSFSLPRRFCKEERAEKIVLCIVGVLCLGAAAVLLLTDQPVLFLAGSAAALLLTGHIGGCVYCRTSLYFAGSRYTGRVIGTGMAAVILLQFVVQNLAPRSVSFFVSLLFSVAVVLYCILRMPEAPVPEAPSPGFSPAPGSGRAAIPLITAVVLMSLVAGMIDSVLTAFNAANSCDIYSGVRLFYGLGLVLAGFLADFRQRKYLPLSTVCAILLSSVCVFFLSDEVSYFAGTALMYLYSGFYVIFFTVMFLDFAPKTRHPELWAGMGRIVRSFSVAAAVLPALTVYDAVGSTALAVGSCLLSILILLVLLPDLGSAISSAPPAEASPAVRPVLSFQERLALYARHCSLTPRETEVLEKLLTTEDGVQEIADSLYISRRMLQRHIASIYEKTETKTRVGLFQSYMNFTPE